MNKASVAATHTCYTLTLVLLLMTHTTTPADPSSEDSAVQYRLTPRLLSDNDSFVSEEDLQLGEPPRVTACVWVRITYFRRPSVPLSLGSKDTSVGDVSIGVVPQGVLLRRGREVWAAAAVVVPLSWYHFCLALTPTTASVFLDTRRLLQVDPVPDFSSFFTGQFRAMMGGSVTWPDLSPSTFSFTKPSDAQWETLRESRATNAIVGSFAGDLLAPSVWNVELTEADVKTLVECSSLASTPQVQPLTWRQYGSSITNNVMNRNEPCKRRYFDYLLFPEPMNFYDNYELCVKLDMEMIRPRDRRDYETLFEDVTSHRACGGRRRVLWLGGEGDRCPALTSSDKEAAPCPSTLCGGCQLPPQHRRLFILRGLCALPDTDLAFVAVSSKTARPHFQGVERYDITPVQDTWELRDGATGDVLATTNGTDPLGVRRWQVTSGLCGASAQQVVGASLSACREHQTLCRSGECIPLARRCDGYPDCPDGYDEEECQPVRRPDGYLINSPPPRPPVDVSLTIEITQVASTEPLTIVLHTKLSWEDPRLTFANLRYDTDIPVPLNSVMWRPRLLVLRPGTAAPDDLLKKSQATSVEEGEVRASLTVRTTAQPIPDTRTTPAVESGLQSPAGTETHMSDTLYPGLNTSITLAEHLNQPVDCHFDLSFYPFDVHVCELPLVLVPHGVHLARLLLGPNSARYTGFKGLTDFVVNDAKIRHQNAQLGGRVHSGVVLQLRLSRQPAFTVLAVFLPSFLLLGVSTGSLWMSHKTPARLIISCSVVGAFLMMWLITAVTSPTSGKVKAVDAWLCFCTMHALLHATLHVLLEVFTQEGGVQQLFSRVVSRPVSRMREVKPIDSGSIYDNLMLRLPENDDNTWTVGYWITFIARVVSPALVLVFNISYWPFVFYFNINPLP